MLVIGVVLLSALLAGAVVGALTWRLPHFDPAAPRVSAPAITREVVANPGRTQWLQDRMNPETATGFALTAALALVLGAGLAIGLLLAMISRDAGLAHYDLSAARWGAEHATNGSTTFLRDVSLLGGTSVMIALAVVSGVIEYVRSRKPEVIAFVIVVVLGQVALVNVIKVLVDRDRPDIARLTGYSGASFPSGHAAAAAATLAVVGFLAGRGRSRGVKTFLAAFVVGAAVAVAVTRVLLGVHWLTDVVAGLAFGWGWFALVSIAFGGRVLSFGQPVVDAERVADAVSP
jgi:membrane-associated phospholipid phosphatase